MAWVTTKDGRRVDTDWFDKDKQIADNKKEADIRAGKEVRSLYKNASKNNKEDMDKIKRATTVYIDRKKGEVEFWANEQIITKFDFTKDGWTVDALKNLKYSFKNLQRFEII